MCSYSSESSLWWLRDNDEHGLSGVSSPYDVLSNIYTITMFIFYYSKLFDIDVL